MAAASSRTPAMDSWPSSPARSMRCGLPCSSRAVSTGSRSAMRPTSRFCSASASMSATSSSARMTSSATASISRRGSRASPSPAASVCRRRPTIRCTARWHDFADLGEQQPQEYRRPIRVYAVVPDGSSTATTGSQRGAGAGFGASALDRGAAVRQYRRRSRAGIFRRWRDREPDHRPVAHQRLVRDRPQHRVRLQGQVARRAADRPRAECPLRARGLGAAGRQPASRQCAADRRRNRQSSLGRTLRQAGRRSVRHAGRNRLAARQRA